MKKKILVDIIEEDDGTVTDRTQTFAWTINDEAIHRGNNYAEQHAKLNQDAVRYKEATVHAILKNAYQEGFLHGFAHKFDDVNYEGQDDK